MIVRIQFSCKKEIIYEWAVYSTPTKFSLLRLLGKVHCGLFKIFWEVLLFSIFLKSGENLIAILCNQTLSRRFVKTCEHNKF